MNCLICETPLTADTAVEIESGAAGIVATFCESCCLASEAGIDTPLPAAYRLTSQNAYHSLPTVDVVLASSLGVVVGAMVPLNDGTRRYAAMVHGQDDVITPYTRPRIALAVGEMNDMFDRIVNWLTETS